MNPAILWIIASTFLFTVINALVKYLDHLSVFQIVFFRSLFSLLVCLPFIYANNIQFKISKDLYLPVFLRSIFGLSGFALLFYSIHLMPLGTSVSIMYTNPIFTLILAQILFKERLSLKHYGYMLVCFAATLLIKNVDTRITLFSFMVAISSAFMASCAYTCIRFLKNKLHQYTIIFYFSLISTILIFPFSYLHWKQISLFDLFLLFLIGVITFFAQNLLTKAYQNHQASHFVHFNYFGILFSVLAGYIFFQETLNFYTMIGIIFLVTSLIRIQKLK